MTLDEWRLGARSHPHHGYSVFFREDGAGDALLCIHGFPTASADWRSIWPELTARYRVVAPDLIGFGFSDKPRQYAYSLQDQASLVENLLEARGVERVHVLAHDYGVSVAQELLARHLERESSGAPLLDLASVCFLNGGLFPETHRALWIQRLLASPLGHLLWRVTGERAFADRFARVFGPDTRPSPEEMAEYWTLVTYNQGLRVQPSLIGYMEERRSFRGRWVAAMQGTAVPLRLINGPLDPVSGRHAAVRYRELVPRPDVHFLDGIGHYPHVEDPQGVLDAYFEFRERY